MTLDELSERDRQVAHMVAQGYRQAKIALAMGYSIAWVQWRLKTIYTQMGVKNRAQLAALVGEERQRRSR